MSKNSLKKLYDDHIKGTPKQTNVADITLYLGTLKQGVIKEIGSTSQKVYIRSKELKHIYDGRPPYHFSLILKHMEFVIQEPDCVYANKPGKHGDFLFYKIIEKKAYLFSIKRKTITTEDGAIEEIHFIVTAWILTDAGYLSKYKVLWEF